MPPRLNKRQQRELEELSHLVGPSVDVVTDEEAPTTVSALGFAAVRAVVAEVYARLC